MSNFEQGSRRSTSVARAQAEEKQQAAAQEESGRWSVFRSRVEFAASFRGQMILWFFVWSSAWILGVQKRPSSSNGRGDARRRRTQADHPKASMQPERRTDVSNALAVPEGASPPGNSGARKRRASVGEGSVAQWRDAEADTLSREGSSTQARESGAIAAANSHAKHPDVHADDGSPQEPLMHNGAPDTSVARAGRCNTSGKRALRVDQQKNFPSKKLTFNP